MPGHYERLGRCAEYLINTSDAVNPEAEHMLNVVGVMSGLDSINATDELRRGLPNARKLP